MMLGPYLSFSLVFLHLLVTHLHHPLQQFLRHSFARQLYEERSTWILFSELCSHCQLLVICLTAGNKANKTRSTSVFLSLELLRFYMGQSHSQTITCRGEQSGNETHHARVQVDPSLSSQGSIVLDNQVCDQFGSHTLPVWAGRERGAKEGSGE